MIEKWELAHFPFEKDAQRYKARVRGSEDDLKILIAKLPVECGRPFITLSQDFDWAFYLYKMDDAARLKAVEIFNSFSPNGTVVEASALQTEKELPSMLEDVLEDTAKHLLEAAKFEPPTSSAERPVPSEPQRAQEVQTAPTANSIAIEEALSTPFNPSYNFSSFIVGTNNRFTHAAAQAVAENPGKIYNPFFIYGGVGLGKTHLMQAIGNFVTAKNPEAKAIFLSTEKFMSLVIEGIRRGEISQLREHFRRLDLLLIDDIQFLSDSESTQEEFFHVFNILHQIGKQIVITSDRPPKQLSTLEDRLRSRFEWGLITDLKAPNLETRVAILKSKADQINLDLTSEQLMFVAEKSKTNIRELEGIIKKIYATSSLMNTKVDLNLIKSVMEDNGSESNISLPAVPDVKAEQKEIIQELPKVSAGKESELEGILQRLNDVLIQPSAPPISIPIPPPPEPPAPPVPTLVLKSVPVVETPTPPVPEPPLAPNPPVLPEPPAPPAASSDESGSPDPDEPDTDLTLKVVEIVCFYPAGKKEDFRKLRAKFNLMLKKHKLKFRLGRVAERSFIFEGKVDYGFFAKACREAKCSIALVLGPPQTPMLSEDDFAGLLSALLEEERIALQFIPWSEMSKDYRYLNCALDLSLLIPAAEKGAPKT